MTDATASSIRILVCVSGGGRSLQNLIERIDAGRLAASIVGVVASRPDVGAIEVAQRRGISARVEARSGRSVVEHSQAIFDHARDRSAELVVLAGFLCLLKIPDDYRDRVINIHPSLIPAFCGKGFHGRSVHEAAVAMGVKVSGCTVHFADDTYDTGPILLQHAVPVLELDDADSLAARVFEAECEALPEAIALIASGRVEVSGRRAIVRP